MVDRGEPDYLEGEGLCPIVGWIPKGDEYVDLLDWYGCFPGMMPWKGTLVGRMRDRSTPMASSVSAYMMLRPLPPSISTLVSHFEPTMRSTTSGYLPGCGMISGWSVRSKVIADSNLQRKGGVASWVV